MEDMRAMDVSGSGTHDEIRSVASDRAEGGRLVAKYPMSQQGQEDLSLSKSYMHTYMFV